MSGELHLIEADLEELESAIAELTDEVSEFLQSYAAFADWLDERGS